MKPLTPDQISILKCLRAQVTEAQATCFEEETPEGAYEEVLYMIEELLKIGRNT